MTQQHRNYEEAARRQDAAEWWLKLQAETAPADDLNQWLQWRADDARNGAAFDDARAFASQLQQVSAAGRAELLAEFAPARPARRRMPMALAAGLGVAVLAGLTWFGLNGGPFGTEQYSYATDVGVNQRIALADGSTLMLGGASRAVVVLSKRERRVSLEMGEGHFTVSQDSQRPFLVTAGAVRVRAIGTAFNVRTAADRVAVTVTAGRIRVDEVAAGNRRHSQPAGMEAGAGQQVSYDGARRLLAVAPADISRAISWQEHRLDFIDEPLSVVIATLNRYSRAPLKITDTAAAMTVFTGTVFPDKLDNWLNALPVAFPLRVHRDGSQVFIGSAAAER